MTSHELKTKFVSHWSAILFTITIAFGAGAVVSKLDGLAVQLAEIKQDMKEVKRDTRGWRNDIDRRMTILEAQTKKTETLRDYR